MTQETSADQQNGPSPVHYPGAATPRSAEGEHWRWCPRCGHKLHNEKCKFRCPRCPYFMRSSDFD